MVTEKDRNDAVALAKELVKMKDSLNEWNLYLILLGFLSRSKDFLSEIERS